MVTIKILNLLKVGFHCENNIPQMVNLSYLVVIE